VEKRKREAGDVQEIEEAEEIKEVEKLQELQFQISNLKFQIAIRN